MAKFHYYLKNPKTKGKTAVFLFIQSNNRRIRYYTGQSIEPKFWNNETQKAVKINHAPEFNTVLNTIKTEGEMAANRLKAELQK